MPYAERGYRNPADRLGRRAGRECLDGEDPAVDGAVSGAIAALRREVAGLHKRLALVEKRTPREAAAPAEVLEKGRFRAMGVSGLRAKLGLSAKDYGKLVGVSGLTIDHWESGKARPRNEATRNKWLAIRGLGICERSSNSRGWEEKAVGPACEGGGGGKACSDQCKAMVVARGSGWSRSIQGR